MNPCLDDVLRRLRAELPESGDAECLLAHALGRDRGWLFAHGDAVLESGELARIEALAGRRRAGEPVAYLTGRRGFWSMDLAVGPATLVPRPETERLVELALERLPADRLVDVADLGTGSGAIALAIAHERPRARVVATDASAAALAVAARNATALGLDASRVAFLQGDWWRPLGARRFELVASNPPYIPEGDPHLDRGDLRFEPRDALASGADGLDAIREIVDGAPAHLVAGGWLLLEHGFDQGGAVRRLMEARGIVEVDTARDLEGRDRVTLGRMPG
ncbi:peptide chain release factor N(5)-glutamine methyltransferase [Luteimonas pelagia]